ncbi:hypothetical protein STBA_57090 [Streptomyces sp. MP131-18]|nr:hypothetical protein STBA_57090 [Streptomyces sp. MP131-18]
MTAQEVEQGTLLLGLRAAGERLAQLVAVLAGAGGLGGDGAARSAYKSPEHGVLRRGMRAQGREVELGREHHWMVRGERGVEVGEPVCRRNRQEPVAVHAGAVLLLQRAGHAAGGLCPQSPGEGVRGQPLGAPVAGQSVEERVRGGVVGLPRGAEGADGRREEDEGVQVGAAGEFVEIPGGVGLGTQDVAETFRGKSCCDAVVEDAGAVDDGAEGVFLGEGGQEGFQ